MKILCSFNDWNANKKRKKLNTWGGIGYYRIVKPIGQITGHEIHLVGRELMNYGKNVGDTWDNIFQEFDVFWTHYFKESANASAMFYMAKKHGKKIIVDLDDNYWDIPESNLLYDQYSAGKKDRALLSTILFFADAIVVSTEPLKERVMKHFRDIDGTEKKVFVIPNCNDKADWPYTPPELHEKKFVIGYAGSNSHHDDLKMVFPSIVKIMEKYPHVYFELIGAIGTADIKKYFDDIPQKIRERIALVGATETYAEYTLWLTEQKWNVGIAPLVDTPFTRAKSHIKFMEYTMAGKPVIASRVYPYFMQVNGKEIITDGETGLLVKNNEWEKALERLILDPELGKRLQRNAYKHVTENLQYGNSNINKVANEMLKSL